MAVETVHIVQAYVAGRGQALRAEEQIGCKTAEDARRKAERLAPLRLGVVAFSVTADVEESSTCVTVEDVDSASSLSEPVTFCIAEPGGPLIEQLPDSGTRTQEPPDDPVPEPAEAAT